MPPIRTSLRTASGIAALALSLPALAQSDDLPPLPELAPMSAAEAQTLPPEYRSLPVEQEVTTTSVDANGIETITRTRRITSSAPIEASAQSPRAYYQPAYAPAAYAQPVYAGSYGYAPVVLDREQWIAECDRRTEGRSKDETGSIIGGLLGAIGGGIAGHELAAAGEALGSTLIGVGVGGIAGILIGSLFNEDDEDRYDCEAALDAYLDQYGENGVRFASRTIPAPAPVAPAYQAYAPTYGYGYSQPPAYYYPPQQTMAMVPVTTYQQQRVIVRETVREETVPGAARTIPPAAPVPVPAPQPQPSPKMIKN